MILNKDVLLEYLKGEKYKTDGDNIEKEYYIITSDNFPLSEKFWSLFIVPQTNRIIYDLLGNKDVERIRKREDKNDDLLYEIAVYNYSIFTKFVYAYNHMKNPIMSTLGEFYAHLASICDLAEVMIEKVFVLIKKCKNEEIVTLQRLSKADVLDIARKWYNDNYDKLYEHYFAKGKYIPVKLVDGRLIIDEYFGKKNKIISDYKKLSGPIRQYRNLLIHSSIIGKITIGNKVYVPKKKVIGKYKRLMDVLNCKYDHERIKHDFVDVEEQMDEDFYELQCILNKIWDKLIDDLYKMIYDDENNRIMEMYGFSFS